MERFGVYGVSHWVALGLFAVGCVALVLIGRSQRGTAEARGFGKALSLAAVLVVIATQAYALLPEEISLDYSLPLQLCDLAWMVSIVALWTRRQWAYALTYYWGLTLSVQGLITPAFAGRDYPSIEYLSFFGLHLVVVWTPVYLTWGAGMRPGWRDYRIAVLVTGAWAAAMLVFNTALGTNYGFLNRKPLAGSLLDLLGPWPWYVVVEAIVILAGWALITLPWITRSREPVTSSGS